MVFFMFDNDDSIFKIFLNGLVTKSVGIDDHKAALLRQCYQLCNQRTLCSSFLVHNLCCVESLAVLVPARDEKADIEAKKDVECHDYDDDERESPDTVQVEPLVVQPPHHPGHLGEAGGGRGRGG